MAQTDAKIREIYGSARFVGDIRYLQREGLPVAEVARALQISRATIYRYMNGRVPANPAVLIAVHFWRAEIQRIRKDQEINGLKPEVFRKSVSNIAPKASNQGKSTSERGNRDGEIGE
ncbi:MAG: helix-turn-helix domain-containing protein [Desulfuromonadaceae bacterium]|nr:helix-turn-helix domain-containing protein [Desulfuromonadaceae bacterium]